MSVNTSTSDGSKHDRKPLRRVLTKLETKHYYASDLFETRSDVGISKLERPPCAQAWVDLQKSTLALTFIHNKRLFATRVKLEYIDYLGTREDYIDIRFDANARFMFQSKAVDGEEKFEKCAYPFNAPLRGKILALGRPRRTRYIEKMYNVIKPHVNLAVMQSSAASPVTSLPVSPIATASASAFVATSTNTTTSPEGHVVSTISSPFVPFSCQSVVLLPPLVSQPHQSRQQQQQQQQPLQTIIKNSTRTRRRKRRVAFAEKLESIRKFQQ